MESIYYDCVKCSENLKIDRYFKMAAEASAKEIASHLF